MIISRTPFRVSLFGGGTDYEEYFLEHGGEVVGFTIDKYCWITLRRLPPFFEYRHRFVYSQIELINHLSEIKHPAIREVLRSVNLECGIELHHDGDLPAKSGLGSSSAFVVGLLNALNAFAGNLSHPGSLAFTAIDIERNLLKENVGYQDQIWAAYGGFQHIRFRVDRSWEVQPIVMPVARREELNRSLMLFFTGFSRFASEIAGKQIANIHAKRRHLKTIREMAAESLNILSNPKADLGEIGWMLHDAWKLKRDLSDAVSTAEIDLIYEAGRSAGAYGGKLLGAGGGGFMLFFVPPERQKSVRERLSSLIHVPFELGSEGSRIVQYDPEVGDGRR